MTKPKPCPFCGSESERTLDHKETCFIRRVLLFNEWLVQKKLLEDYSEPKPYSYEELKDAWNTRYERTCNKGRCERMSEDYACGSCIHCADRHGTYRTNDGVCLLVGTTVRKGDDRDYLRACGIRYLTPEVGYVPAGFERRVPCGYEKEEGCEQRSNVG